MERQIGGYDGRRNMVYGNEKEYEYILKKFNKIKDNEHIIGAYSDFFNFPNLDCKPILGVEFHFKGGQKRIARFREVSKIEWNMGSYIKGKGLMPPFTFEFIN